MAETCSVLVIEPSDVFRDFLDVIVDHVGYDVVAVDAGEMARSHLERRRFDVVLLASSACRNAPDTLQLARRATEGGAAVIIVLEDWSHRRAFAAGGYALLTKPFGPAALIAELEHLRRHEAFDCELRQAAK